MSMIEAVPDLNAALESANTPTLQLVLAQLTGDDGWITGEFAPTRTVALDDNDTAGLSPPQRAQVRAALLDALARSTGPEAPEPDRLVALLSASLGEQVAPEYGVPMAEDAGFVAPRWQRRTPLGGPRVLLVGAGLYGVAMAAALRRLAVPYVHVEAADGVGGTWRANSYPGAGVDTPCHLYSYSFAPRADWSRHFAKQPEILRYVEDTARDLGVLEAIRFGTEVVSAVWDEPTRTWEVRTRDRTGAVERHVADAVISAVGIFSGPVVPGLPGLDRFRGTVVHTANWPPDLDVRGARIGVLGTGATAMQVIPAVAPHAARTVVFQRSPQWVAPNANYLRPVGDPLVRVMAQVPGYRSWYRARLMWQYQDKLHPSLQKDPSWPHPERSLNADNDRHRRFFTAHLDAQLAGGGEHLRDALLPTYPPYGKRILLDNDWFATLRRPDVELVDGGVAAVDDRGVLSADGRHHELDVLVLATGFETRRMLHPLDVRGRSGVPLREQWGDDDARAYLGVTVPDFPNFFVLYGPHTNTGHGGSAIFIGECQVNYVVELLAAMREHGLAAVEVRRAVSDAYNDRLDAAHERMVWTHPGMSTYYRNAAGRVVTTMPWRLVDYWAMTRTPDLTDYAITPA